MHIGILTGGGDVPGLNRCIRAATEAALDRGWRVTGLRGGWAGALAVDSADPASVARHTVVLDRDRVRGIDRLGGTILHTSRLDPRDADGTDRTGDVLRLIEALGLDALLTLGGDGTLRFSAHLSALGVPVISVPKTMDNDVWGTDYCLGFATAVSRSVEAINALRTTVESHERVGVVELFGRRSGETALLAGFLAQVDRTLIAEAPVDPARLIPLLLADKAANPANYAMCVVSEGARLIGEGDDAERSKPATQRSDAGVGQRLARAIEGAPGGSGTVVQELAYLMRAGEPDALDRMAGMAFGLLAVQLLAEGIDGRMVALVDGNYEHVTVDAPLGGVKRVDVARLYDEGACRARLGRVLGMPMLLH